jgi:hypothetical protein
MNVGNLYCHEQSLGAEGSCLQLPETAPRVTTLAGYRARFLDARWIVPGRRKQRPSDLRVGSRQ